jgi:hypothetical protein
MSFLFSKQITIMMPKVALVQRLTGEYPTQTENARYSGGVTLRSLGGVCRSNGYSASGEIESGVDAVGRWSFCTASLLLVIFSAMQSKYSV